MMLALLDIINLHAVVTFRSEEQTAFVVKVD